MKCRICLHEIEVGPETDPVIQHLLESGALGGPALALADAAHVWCQAAEDAARRARPTFATSTPSSGRRTTRK